MKHGLTESPVPQSPVIAMGRYGGMETGYSSDGRRDVRLRIPRPRPTPGRDDLGFAQLVVVRLRAMLAAPSTDPAPRGSTPNLRPEGPANGPLVRSLAFLRQVTTRAGSSPWEAQAAVCGHDSVFGDAELGARFIEMIDPGALPPAEGA